MIKPIDRKILKKEAREFWKDLIYKDGKLDEEQVLRELEDYYFAINEVPKVYMHITNGKLSKIMYYADTVIAEADDIISKEYVFKDDLRDLIDD